MRKDSLGGTGKVYKFTVRQLLKSKSNRITFIIFALLAILAVPVACMLIGDESALQVSAVTRVYVHNETEYELDTGDMGEYFAAVNFTSSPDGLPDSDTYLGTSELSAHIFSDTEKGALALTISKQNGSSISDADIEMLRSALYDCLSQARLSALGATQAQLDIVMSDYTFDTMNASEYDSNEAGSAASYAVQYAYAIILLIVTMFSAVFIIRAIIEEKASKLVEVLMMSVKPLALLAGKILAVMTYIFGLLFSVIILFVISYNVSGMIFDTSSIGRLIANMGVTPEILNISPVAFISIIFSLILSYLTFSLLAGLSGTSCSNMEDVESANMTVTFTVLAAYIVSIFVSAFGSQPLAVIGSLVPIVSAFVAPVQYILGGIELWMLAVSWVIQLAVIGLLAAFSARVYTGLIMHSGNRIRLKTLLLMYRQQPGEEAL